MPLKAGMFEPLEAEFLAMWALGTELKSSGQAVIVLDH